MDLSNLMKDISFFKPSEISIPFKKIGFTLGALTLTQWLTTDVAHIPFGGLGVLTAGAGIWWFTSFPKGSFKKPSSVKGWITRCNEVLGHFESLEDPKTYLKNSQNRSASLQKIMSRDDSQSICFVSTKDIKLPHQTLLESAFIGNKSLNLSCYNYLPVQNHSKKLPENIYQNDLIVYFLPLPLRAVDLIWLEMIPETQPSWIMTTWEESSSWQEQLEALQFQLPGRWKKLILRLDGSDGEIIKALHPIKNFLKKPARIFDATSQRLLERLHHSWQNDLEEIRREEFKVIQNRSQWLVAGAVFASPVPTTDVLSVAVVNGLMIKDMAKLWSCNLKPELLQAIAKQLSMAALAQGVVEWSGQALLGLAKLHGGTWLAAGSMQALSAAYLTRVVGRSMADWMALNNGVSEPDLNLLKQEAPKLVAKAMDEEKVDWSSFIKQSTNWINDQKSHPRIA